MTPKRRLHFTFLIAIALTGLATARAASPGGPKPRDFGSSLVRTSATTGDSTTPTQPAPAPTGGSPEPVPSGGCPAATYLYVGVWSPSRIYRFDVDCTTGELTAQGYRSAPADVRDMAVGPDGLALYYAAINLTKYDISAGGVLTQVGTVQVGNGMFDDVVLDRAGEFLYGTHSQGPPNGGKLIVFDVASAALPLKIQEVFGPIGPHGIALDFAEAHVYIANQSSFVTYPPDTAEIGIFPRSAATGLVNAAGYAFTGWLTSPNYFAMDSDGDFLYFTQTPGSDVVVGQIQNGSIDPTSCSAEFSGAGATQLTFGPGDGFLYVTNGFANSLSVFAVESATGCLTLVETVSVPGRPEHVLRHPTQPFLYVASPGTGSGSSLISVYAIEAGGLLSLVEIESIADQGAYRMVFAAQD